MEQSAPLSPMQEKATLTKTPYALEEQLRLRALAIEKIKQVMLPDVGITKILLIGSSVKGNFGEYSPPGFRGSLYSDFDFIVYVTDDYIIPSTVTREPRARPFEKHELNEAYRIEIFIEDKYGAEVFFVRAATLADAIVCAEGEMAGIPMTEETNNPFITVYP